MRFSDWFDDSDIEVQLSRYRFVYEGVASESATWDAIRAEYRSITAQRAALLG